MLCTLGSMPLVLYGSAFSTQKIADCFHVLEKVHYYDEPTCYNWKPSRWNVERSFELSPDVIHDLSHVPETESCVEFYWSI